VSDALSQAKQSTPEIDVDRDYSMGSKRQADSNSELSLMARVEALLFVADSSVTIQQLATGLQVSSRQIKQALNMLDDDYKQRGLRIQRSKSEVQLTSAPFMAIDIERFLNIERSSRLTRAALEVLAIIAYQQPVTRPHIDSIRGVNSDSVLRTLLRHGLIEDVGRSEGPGRPILYTTTSEFLQHFGINTLKELPQLSPTPVLEDDETRAEGLTLHNEKDGD
jgi:segregation and condensation protein B